MRKTTLFILLVGIVLFCGSAFGVGRVTWQRVANAGIPGHNIRILEKISLEEAKQKCIEGGFKSLDYERKARRAYLQDVNMDDMKLKTDYKDHPYDHYTLRYPSEIEEFNLQPIGVLKASSGDVWYGRSAEELETNPQRLKSGDDVWVNYYIKTGKTGRAFFMFGNGLAQVTIGSVGTLNVKKYTEKVVMQATGEPRTIFTGIFNLVHGNIRALTGIMFGKGDRICVETKNSTCGCRGTDFVVGHDEVTGTDIVLVKEGVVDVTGRVSGEVMVHAGEQVRVRNGTPEAVTKLDEALWRKHMPPERPVVR